MSSRTYIFICEKVHSNCWISPAMTKCMVSAIRSQDLIFEEKYNYMTKQKKIGSRFFENKISTPKPARPVCRHGGHLVATVAAHGTGWLRHKSINLRSCERMAVPTKSPPSATIIEFSSMHSFMMQNLASFENLNQKSLRC